ncbi:MAG: hypothetical protein HQ594_01595 [Candidatus Omnitrophica bacterium]|nr:hypothetical protein [Candidatus Omnitrophota bacterium]
MGMIPGRESLDFGWETTKKYLGFFIVISIIVLLAQIVPRSLQNVAAEDVLILAFLIGFAGWVIQKIIDMGFIKICLKCCDNEKGEFSDLIPTSSQRVINFILGSIIYGVIVTVGTILLIVPGIIWSLKFQFFGYFIIDEGLGPIDALKKSGMITKGVKGNLFVFALVIVLINIVGMLLLLVGLFVTIPLTTLAFSYMYRSLLKRNEGVAIPENFDISFR